MTGPHISEELPALLTGEASRDVTLVAATHLRGCVDCQQELVSAVIAHAALSSAQRFAPEVVATPDRVDPEPEPPALPDLSGVFAGAREESTRSRPGGSIKSHRARYLLVAAAAAVLIGGGSAAIVTATGGHSTAHGRTVALAAFDAGTTPGTARIDAGTMTIDATALPQVTGRRYEVWLTNAHRTRMQPVGWIDAEGRATLTVPAELITRFSNIEVSVQPVNAASYDYSGTSVLRGAYR